MIIRQKNGMVEFRPENDSDIFNLGKFSRHVSEYSMDFKLKQDSGGLTPTNNIEVFKISDDELMSFIIKAIQKL